MSWRSLRLFRGRSCPEGWELSRAFSEGTSVDIAIHLRRCERCAEHWAGMQRTRDVADTLSLPALGQHARQRMLATLLAEVGSAAVTPSRGTKAWRVGFAVVALSALVAVFVGLLGHPRGHRPAGDTSAVSIQVNGSATFTRQQPLPDEIVRLDEGTLLLDVSSLRPGERLRIATADAQVETEGGRLEVSASGHQLVAVRVWRGHTEVRGAAFHVDLKSGDVWTRVSPGTAPILVGKQESKDPLLGPISGVRAMKVQPQRADAPLVRGGAPSLRDPDLDRASHKANAARTSAFVAQSRGAGLLAPVEKLPPMPSVSPRGSFERGWNLLRAGDPKSAADAFRDVERQSHGDAITEDAVFWRAVAEARAGASREARGTLSSFLSRFPRSARIGEASAMLGWILLDAGDDAAARQAFERARTDIADRVRASAEAGLARIAAQTPASSAK